MDNYEESFQKLKNFLTSALVLTLLSGSRGFMFYYDASKVKLGYVLMQHDKVIAYASK